MITLYAAHLATRLHQNIEHRKQFMDLVALLIQYLQYLDQLNLPSTSTPRYLTGYKKSIFYLHKGSHPLRWDTLIS